MSATASIETRLVDSVMRGDRKIAYIVDGDIKRDVPVFVCFHGMFANAQWFVDKKGGAPETHTIVSIDRMGYGKSSYISPKNFSYTEVVEDVKAVTAKLGVEKFFVMAHSAGGPNGLNVAAALPSQVLGLGMLAGETEYTSEGAPQVPAGIKCFVGNCVGGCCIPLCPCVCDWGFFGDWKLKHEKYPYELEDINVPTILYYAEKDDIIDAKLTNFTAARIKNAKVEMISGKDHFSCATPEFQHKMAVELIAAVRENVAAQPVANVIEERE